MRVLSACDDIGLRAVLREALKAGVVTDFVEAPSARDSLARLDGREPCFDAVILDMRLPDGDGVETCAAIRLKPAYRDTPVIVLAEPGDMSALSQAFIAGASDYVFKPFHAVELQARLRLVLRHKAEIDRRREHERELRRLRRPGHIWRSGEGPSIDAESGLPGRAALTGSLNWHAAREDGAPLSVIVAQIDAMTSYRHLRGPEETSATLRRVGSTLGALDARLDTLLAAFETGGYAIVAGSAEAASRALAEAARTGVAALAIPHLESALHDHVSVSVGLAIGARGARERVAQLLPDAICAAEQAAAEGGNRVVVVEGF